MGFSLGGFLQNTFDDIRGKTGENAARGAASTQAGYYQQGIDEIRKQNAIDLGLYNDSLDRYQDVYDDNIERLMPFYNQGVESLEQVSQGSTAGGMNERLASIINGSQFGELVDVRRGAAEDYISKQGLSRSGSGVSKAASIPAELALALEEQLYGRQSQLMQQGLSAGRPISYNEPNRPTSNNYISQLLSKTGEALGQGQVEGTAARTAGSSNLLDIGGSLLKSGALGKAAGFIGGLFSDPKLKENMREIGQVADLTMYQWDWKDEVPEQYKDMTVGFNADEVEEKYPNRIVYFGGFKAVDYTGLIEDIKKVA
jgi:hypothetical protein